MGSRVLFYLSILSCQAIQAEMMLCRGNLIPEKYHRCLPLTVEVFPCYSNITLALLPFFPLILRHQCVCGERHHADAVCKQVCTSARQNHVGSLRFSMEANMQAKVKIEFKKIIIIPSLNPAPFLAHKSCLVLKTSKPVHL